MGRDRDIDAFSTRAPSYDAGAIGRFHRDLATRAIRLAGCRVVTPRRILDVGCGTGYALQTLATTYRDCQLLAGVDPAPGMLGVASKTGLDPRIQLVSGVAEQLPFADGAFDLVLATTTFDHWSDQQVGLSECRRVLTREGVLVLTDLIGVPLLPTLAFRPGRARTRRQITHALRAAGFRSGSWQRTFPPIIQTVTADQGFRG